MVKGGKRQVGGFRVGPEAPGVSYSGAVADYLLACGPELSRLTFSPSTVELLLFFVELAHGTTTPVEPPLCSAPVELLR